MTWPGPEQLRTENAELPERVALLEHRTAAVDGIVTHRGYDLAAQIEPTRPMEDRAAYRETAK